MITDRSSASSASRSDGVVTTFLRRTFQELAVECISSPCPVPEESEPRRRAAGQAAAAGSSASGKVTVPGVAMAASTARS